LLESALLKTISSFIIPSKGEFPPPANKCRIVFNENAWKNLLLNAIKQQNS